jgi:hypothetical protein
MRTRPTGTTPGVTSDTRTATDEDQASDHLKGHGQHLRWPREGRDKATLEATYLPTASSALLAR